MLNFAQCLVKADFVLGLHGGNDYKEGLQSILQQLYNMPIRFINVSEESLNVNQGQSLFPEEDKKEKEKELGIISCNFFRKIKSTPIAVIICFDTTKASLLDSALTTSILKTIEQVQMKNPKKALIVLLFSRNASKKESDTFIRSIRSRVILEKRFLIHIKNDTWAIDEKVQKKLLLLELHKIAFNVYKNKKIAYDNKRKKADLPQETQAKIAIKQAYISLLFQIDRIASSYYKEAYEIVNDKLPKRFDSIHNKRHFFIQQRNASDWLLVNIFDTLKMDSETKKLAMLNHVSQFDYELYFGKGVNDKKNIEVDLAIVAMSYYWKICFDDYFGSLIEEEKYKDFKAFALINSIRRLLTYLKLNSTILMSTLLDMTKVTQKDLLFVEKIPSYFLMNEDNKVECSGEMVVKVLFRKFIEKFNMTYKRLSYALLEKANKLFKSNDQWSQCQFSLKMLASTCDELEDKDIEPLYSSLINNPNIELFPIIYLDLLQKYNEVLLRMTPLNVNQIIFNLIKISEFRDLTAFEYETIKNILSETMTTMQSLIFQVNSVNRLIQPSYTFSSYAPSICQLITFTLTINLNIDDCIKFKVKSIILQFNNLARTKKMIYTAEQSPVFSKSLPLVISYEIFIQPSDSNLFLSNVQLETQNGMIFLISIKEDVAKSLKTITEQDLKTHLSLNYSLNHIVGLNENHYFNFGIEKKNDHIIIDEIDAIFLFKDTNTIIPSHQFIRRIDGVNTVFTNKLSIVHKEPGDIKGVDFLLKCASKLKEEAYKLSFEIRIKIYHVGLKADYFLYEEKGVSNVKVKDSFACSHDIRASCFMNEESSIAYPTKRKIKDFISIKNNLDAPMCITGIKLIPFDETIQMHSQYEKYFKRIPFVLPLSEFVFPVIFVSEAETYQIGKVEVSWTTEELMAYGSSVANMNSFDLPSVTIKRFDISVDIEVDKSGMMLVRLNNNTDLPGQTQLMVDIDQEEVASIITGRTLDKIMLPPYSSIESRFDLVPIDERSSIEHPKVTLQVFKFGKNQKGQKELYSIILESM